MGQRAGIAGAPRGCTRNPGVVTTTGSKWEAGNTAKTASPLSMCVTRYRGQFWGACLYSLLVFEVCFYEASKVIGGCGQSGAQEGAKDLQGSKATESFSPPSSPLTGMPRSIRTEDFTGSRLIPSSEGDHSDMACKF